MLAGLGVGSLSMAPSKATTVRDALSLHDLATCQGMARSALVAPTATAARQTVLAKAHEDLLALL